MPFTVAILAVVLSYTWLLESRLPGDFVGVPVAIVAALGAWNAFRTKEWGLGVRAFIPGLRAAALFTLPIVVILLASGAALGTLHDRPGLLANFGVLVVWGVAQQWILQTVVLGEAQRVASRRAGVIVAALLFGAVHLPNPFLTLATVAGALGWCAIYARYPNILPLAFSQAIGTLAVLHAFDDRITGRLRIGYSYLMLDRG